MARAPAGAPSWLAPLAVRAVWLRAAKVALPVGVLQACINQGEFWVRGEFTAGVITRSLLTPVISLTVGLLAAASTYRLIGGDTAAPKSEE